MRIKSFAVPVAALALAGCETLPPGSSYPGSGPSSSYCVEQPAICALVGIVVVGGIIMLVRDNNDSGGTMYTSDTDLKQNMRHVKTLENGIKLYAFQYLGDDRTFVGVSAQELAGDVRFADAVSVGPDGYLAVDYGKLGLKVVNSDAMLEAGQNALAESRKL